MSTATNLAISWVEQGYVPDPVIRAGIRRLLKSRLEEIEADRTGAASERMEAFIREMAAADMAPLPEKANEQHYEVPASFFLRALGSHRKYSCCWWPEGTDTLDEAEALALNATCERAGLADGQDILELGCGWGSLSLWMAERFPRARITAVSNSRSQRAYIEQEAQRRGLKNLRILTQDMNVFDIADRFDRIVSVEMCEHLRNWPLLFSRIRSWLKPGGRFFMHVFVHRSTPYAFEARDESDWMSRHFFSGGMMPSDDLAARFQDDLKLLQRWRWDGTHYEKTCNAWLARMDDQRDAVMPILEQTYGKEQAAVWWMRWRIFFMSCAELFGYEHGQQWWVSHYLFERRPD
ncbi:SAM-dependent methyltransferase [Noviherbaspirillum galbum]|uniref:Class I SAM-dependent methyltransferase n=1 Tax=Noviherbaspirillum galbum TaxID=2709383 RepID=A0A6B3SMF9_9BURK|nr:cyclopropane-fatty-acyl-phospholipid synthase family protein [Noviherbaspirillum galbum]NEX59562.1 class I SAM-dependent methyltransferase [Noviherbaspirillum galbum]